MALTIENANIGYDKSGMITVYNNIKANLIEEAINVLKTNSETLKQNVDTYWIGASADAFKNKLEVDTQIVIKRLNEISRGLENELNQMMYNVNNYDATLAEDIRARMYSDGGSSGGTSKSTGSSVASGAFGANVSGLTAGTANVTNARVVASAVADAGNPNNNGDLPQVQSILNDNKTTSTGENSTSNESVTTDTTPAEQNTPTNNNLEQTATTENIATDNNQEQTAADNNQEQTAADNNQEQTVADNNQEQTAADNNQEQTVADNNQEQAVADNNQEQAVADNNQEQTVADEVEEQNSKETEETIFTEDPSSTVAATTEVTDSAINGEIAQETGSVTPEQTSAVTENNPINNNQVSTPTTPVSSSAPVDKEVYPTLANKIDGREEVLDTMIDFFRGKGLNDMQIAAVVGNAAQESGLVLDVKNSNSSATGLFQWLTDRQPSSWDLNTQLEHTWNEIENTRWDGKVLEKLQSATSVDEATEKFCYWFEGADCGSNRKNYANDAYAYIQARNGN